MPSGSVHVWANACFSLSWIGRAFLSDNPISCYTPFPFSVASFPPLYLPLPPPPLSLSSFHVRYSCSSKPSVSTHPFLPPLPDTRPPIPSAEEDRRAFGHLRVPSGRLPSTRFSLRRTKYREGKTRSTWKRAAKDIPYRISNTEMVHNIFHRFCWYDFGQQYEKVFIFCCRREVWISELPKVRPPTLPFPC